MGFPFITLPNREARETEQNRRSDTISGGFGTIGRRQSGSTPAARAHLSFVRSKAGGVCVTVGVPPEFLFAFQ